MQNHTSIDLRTSLALLLGAFIVAAATQADAFPGTLSDWQSRYGAVSPSGDNARCQLCHANSNGGVPWNAYGWDIGVALDDPGCDLDGDGAVTNAEAFYCIEPLNSDGDGGGNDNLAEIVLGTQPGWTLGPNNTLYNNFGTIPGALPPNDIGPIDPDGSEPPPPEPPPPPSDEDTIPPGQFVRDTIVVKPGQSIQEALDRAQPGTRIYVLSGVYRELSDPTNGLRITKNGIRLIGQSNPEKRVILQNAGNQRNGIVVVPPEATDCMSCHASMAPPFELLPGVEPGLPDPQPLLYDIEVSGITIEDFTNNGLFTERVDGFTISDVESVGNKNYGIFPTLSRNGIVTRSRATGSDDSGIWVETSENVEVTHNLVEGNVNGFEVSNSDDILLAHNEARGNTVGAAILLLPDIFDDRPGAKRIDMRDNWVHDNNKPNTARPGSILSFVPSGTGILYLGVDGSLISHNRIENNDFAGVAIADYCLTVLPTPFNCSADPDITPEFVADQAAENNRVVENVLVNNGTNPDPGSPFAFAAADFSLITLGPGGNCYEDNVFSTFFSLIGILPPCN
jgi:parallel beta-helix repeat protein